MIATNLTIVIHAGTLAALRAQVSSGLVALNLATCLHSAGNRALYRWATSSTATDDGMAVVKPTDISAANPGRWLLVDWVETAAEGFHGEVFFSVDLGASASATAYAEQVGNNWCFAGITIEGSNRRAWFRKRVD
jgi:hypothetical protein